MSRRRGNCTLGVDPGTRQLGVAVARDRRLITAYSVDLTRGGQAGLPERIRNIGIALDWANFEHGPVAQIVREDVRFGRSVKAHQAMGAAMLAIDSWADLRGLGATPISVADVKRAAGVAANSRKAEITAIGQAEWASALSPLSPDAIDAIYTLVAAGALDRPAARRAAA